MPQQLQSLLLTMPQHKALGQLSSLETDVQEELDMSSRSTRSSAS